MNFIDLKEQYRRYRDDIARRMQTVLEHGQYVMGPEIDELESTLADYVGVRHAITVASGTDSLEIGLRALGVGPGDDVITVPFTWISTAEAVRLVGAKPVFVDIDPVDYNMAVDRIEAAITPRTRALMPVSLFGQMPDYDRINALAAKYRLPVIEDAAQSFGATRHGRRSGGVTTLGSTSFFPAKPLGCFGDGGALFTDDDGLADTVRAIRNHGGQARHHHTLVGKNGRFDTLQAAVLLAKWPYFDEEVRRRNEIGARYSERLIEATQGSATGAKLGTPAVREGNTHVYAQYTLRVADRDALGKALKQQGIPTAVYYPKCLHEQPVFADCGYRPGDFPVAEQAARDVISLPMHPFLNETDQDKIVAAVTRAVESF